MPASERDRGRVTCVVAMPRRITSDAVVDALAWSGVVSVERVADDEESLAQAVDEDSPGLVVAAVELLGPLAQRVEGAVWSGVPGSIVVLQRVGEASRYRTATALDPSERLARLAWRVGSAALGERRPEPVTPREQEVLACIRRGSAPADIAAELGCGVETVRTHIKSLCRKFGVRDRAALAVKAIHDGLWP